MAGIADEAKLKEIDKEIKDIVTAAAEFAQDSPEPDPAEFWTDVYAEASHRRTRDAPCRSKS